MIRVLLVAGARPNFMKIMPLLREMARYPKRFKPVLVHTGQHYDFNMSAAFFKDLDIPRPDIYLGVGSATHGAQTAKVIEGIEKILLKEKFDLVVVVGDVNSTIAAALAAVKLGVKVAHVEAGLRSFDRNMPEEINRVLTDHISDFLFTTESYGNKNLLREGASPSKIFFVGNIMVDSHMICKPKIATSKIVSRLGLENKDFCLVTIHRPSNVDNRSDLARIVNILHSVSKRLEVVFPVHPRARKMLNKHHMKLRAIRAIEPLGYVDFHRLLKDASMVITDSGGIQEEATVLNVPCLTVRDTTERPVTITIGTNELTGPDRGKILRAIDKIIAGKWKKGHRPARWDGKTAKRIIDIISRQERYICAS